MSDARLRELQRRAERGEPGARAALLGERLRLGDLPLERLELAIYVGDDDARAAFSARWTWSWAAVRGRPVDGAVAVPQHLDEWLSGLARWGLETMVRAGAAALRSRGFATPALEAAEDWAVCPCAAHAAACRAQARILDWVAGDLARLAGGRQLQGGAAAVVLPHALESAPIRAAIRDEVGPWALGERDPVRDRRGRSTP